MNKITIIGAGKVGSTIAYTLSVMNLAKDIVMIDINHELALGTSPNPLIKSTTEGLETQKWGGIVADADTGLTSRPGVYAGGDAVSGAATVILAMGAGKNAAKAIDEYIRNK